MKPRIAILTNYQYDESMLVGGVESATEGLLEGLEGFQDEFEFHVVAITRALGPTTSETRRGFYFHFLAAPQSFLLRPRTFYLSYACSGLLRHINPALVHCHDNKALALGAIRFGRADIFTVHGVKRDEARKWQGEEYWSHQLDGMLERYVNKRFTMFIAVSTYGATALPDGSSYSIIPNALSKEWFVEKDPESNRVDRLVCIGSYNRLKRQQMLLDAVKILKKELGSCEIILGGSVDDRNYFNELKRFVSLEGLTNVQLRGALTRGEVSGLLSDNTVLVHPSAQENSPMVIAEAMARGVPVVASRVGGIPEMVKDGREGLLFDVDTLAGLVEALRRVIGDQVLRSTLGSNGRGQAKRLFDPAVVADKTVEVYREVLKSIHI